MQIDSPLDVSLLPSLLPIIRSYKRKEERNGAWKWAGHRVNRRTSALRWH